MVDIVSLIGVVATIAVTLMVLVMLWFVRNSMGNETHQPSLDEGTDDAA
ncbi:MULTISPECIES: hypothetical protein [unclassified Haloparvum]